MNEWINEWMNEWMIKATKVHVYVQCFSTKTKVYTPFNKLHPLATQAFIVAGYWPSISTLSYIITSNFDSLVKSDLPTTALLHCSTSHASHNALYGNSASLED